jgi:hypothetical protein
MVMRCPACTAAQIVLLDVGGHTRLHVQSLAAITLDPAGDG